MANWCCLCKFDGESASHLLLHCPIASDLQVFYIAQDHLGHAKLPSYVMPMLESWKGALKLCSFKEVRGSIFACLMLCTWTEKSQPTFMGKELTLPNFKSMFLKTLYEWSSKSYTFQAYSLEFLDSFLIRR